MRKSRASTENTSKKPAAKAGYSIEDVEDDFIDDMDDPIETDKFEVTVSGGARRKLEELMEQKSLKKMIDDDYYDFD
jgi:hypothetical protein